MTISNRLHSNREPAHKPYEVCEYNFVKCQSCGWTYSLIVGQEYNFNCVCGALISDAPVKSEAERQAAELAADAEWLAEAQAEAADYADLKATEEDARY